MNISLKIVIIFLAGIYSLHAQPGNTMHGAELQRAVKKLNVLGSVLYLAAHPDDENTAFLATMSGNKMLRAGYLSLTRGGGGQNLLGSEKGPLLSVLRTHELLSARKIDGAEQYFTRAVDFGYSKSAEETLSKWDREKVLGDIVRVIRTFKPDVIATRFTPEKGGHGQHLSSAILGIEAFKAAADPGKYPEQLEKTGTWQTKRIVWNAWNPQTENRPVTSPSLVAEDLGVFDPLLGKSYLELSALSRSMHKSQGFGVSAFRGSWINYFEHMEGVSARQTLFDDIDLTWGRVPGSENAQKIINQIIAAFNAAAPSKSLAALLSLKKELTKLPHHWAQYKLKEVDHIIQSCAGLWLEAITADYATAAGDSLILNLTALNRSDAEVVLRKIILPVSSTDTTLATTLASNTPLTIKIGVVVPKGEKISNPYWQSDIKNEYYDKPVRREKMYADFLLSISGEPVAYRIPLLYRWTDRVKGELYRPHIIAPAVTANINTPTLIFANNQGKEISGFIQAWKSGSSGQLYFDLPAGWRAEPRSVAFNLSEKYDRSMFKFTLFPPQQESSSSLRIRIRTNGYESRYAFHQIEYDHIPAQLVFTQVDAKIVRLDIERSGKNIGYVMGSGDEIPQSLEQIGYVVQLLSDEDLAASDFKEFDTIITGTRAYNVRSALYQNRQRLYNYVEDGGTLVTLHNTRFGLQADQMGPHSFKISRHRVSVEESAVSILNPEHPLFTGPNRISEKDFHGWVQERGLYFAGEWDDKYQPLLACNDPGEPPRKGGMLYTKYGKGHYIFSAYSWFRQLPAGVPGAFRLFINLISIGNEQN